MINESALAEWHAITNFLNDWIKKNGKIEPNNHELWREYLHRWDNQDWTEILQTVAKLHERYPEYFQRFHRDAVMAAVSVLLEHGDTKRVMDRKEHKKIAWKAIMTMREVWNAACDIYLPNEHQPKSNFDKIYQIEEN